MFACASRSRPASLSVFVLLFLSLLLERAAAADPIVSAYAGAQAYATTNSSILSVMTGSTAGLKAEWSCASTTIASCPCDPNCPTNATQLEVVSASGAYARPAVTLAQCGLSGQVYSCSVSFLFASDARVGPIQWKWTLRTATAVSHTLTNTASTLGSFIFFPPLSNPTIRISSDTPGRPELVSPGYSVLLNVSAPYPGILAPTVTIWNRPAFSNFPPGTVSTFHVFSLAFNLSLDYLDAVRFTVTNIADGVHTPITTVFTTTSNGGWVAADIGLKPPSPVIADPLEIVPDSNYLQDRLGFSGFTNPSGFVFQALVFPTTTVQPPYSPAWSTRNVQALTARVTIPCPGFELSLNRTISGFSGPLWTSYNAATNTLSVIGWGSQAMYTSVIQNILFRNTNPDAAYLNQTAVSLTLTDEFGFITTPISRIIRRPAYAEATPVTIQPGELLDIFPFVGIDGSAVTSCRASLWPVQAWDDLGFDETGSSGSWTNYLSIDSVNKVLTVSTPNDFDYSTSVNGKAYFSVKKGVSIPLQPTTRWITATCGRFSKNSLNPGSTPPQYWYVYRQVTVTPAVPSRTYITPGTEGFLVSRNLFWKMGLCCFTDNPQDSYCQACISDGQIVAQYLVDTSYGNGNQGQNDVTTYFFNASVSLSAVRYTTVNGIMKSVQDVLLAQQLGRFSWSSQVTNLPWVRTFPLSTSRMIAGLFIDDSGTLKLAEAHTGSLLSINPSLFDISTGGRTLQVVPRYFNKVTPSFFQGNYIYNLANNNSREAHEQIDQIFNDGDTPLLYERTLIQTTNTRTSYAVSSSSTDTYRLGFNVDFSASAGGATVSAGVSGSYDNSETRTAESEVSNEVSNSTSITLRVSIPPRVTMTLTKDLVFESLKYSSDNLLTYCYPFWGYCKFIDQKVAPDVGIQKSYLQYHFTMHEGGAK